MQTIWKLVYPTISRGLEWPPQYPGLLIFPAAIVYTGPGPRVIASVILQGKYNQWKYILKIVVLVLPNIFSTTL